MKLSRRLLLLLTLTAGCSGSGGVSTPTGVIFTLDWPDATRALPQLAKSVHVQIKQGAKLLAERLYLAGTDTDEQIAELPFATALTLVATAYPSSDGTGAPLAGASIPFSTLKGKLERVNLTLASVIKNVTVSLVKGATSLELTATPRDSAGSTILTAPTQWEWTLDDPSLGTLTASGATATFTETGFGVARLTATEKESLVAGALTRPVCVGEPSKVAPPLTRVPLSGALTGLVALSSGRFALAPGTTLSGIDSLGATLWQRSLSSPATELTALAGGFLAVRTTAGFRIHSSETGAFYWELAGAPPSASIPTAVFFQRPASGDTAESLEARGMTTGELLWSKPVAAPPLVWADTTRLIGLDTTSGLYAVFQSTLGNLSWSTSVPAGSQFIGLRTDISAPLLLSFSPGELRGILLANGVRLWSVAAAGETAYLTPDKTKVIVYSQTACAGYDSSTGAQVWSKAGLREVVGPLPNGDLVVLPTVEDTDCQAFQAIRPIGSIRWTSYLPLTALPNERFIPTILGSRIVVTLSKAATYETAPLYGQDSVLASFVWGTRQYLGGRRAGSDETIALQGAPGTSELLLLR
jgi:hypothetical protein